MTALPPQPRTRRGLLKLLASWRPSHHKSGTFTYGVLLPAIFITLALLTLGLVAFAAGVLLRIIPYR